MLSLSLNSSTSATFDDSRAIKVLVVPIGENSEYDAQFQAIASSVREIQINDLVKPSEWDAQVSASFQNFSWYKGNFKFDYLRYDRVPNGPGDLDNFLSSRRVLMIMGIINYPELGANPAEKIQQELDYFTRRHPYVVLRRLFLFNYAFPETPITSTSDASVGPMDVYEELVSPQLRSSRTSTSIYNNTSALEIDGQKDPNLLVVFPPNLMCGHGGEGGYVNDDDNGPIHKHPSSEALGGEGAVSMVDVHLQVNMENSACKLIASFADQMRVCDTALAQDTLPVATDQIPLSTFYDDILEHDATKSANNNALYSNKNITKATYKEKPAGRVLKWMGDICMQMCSPRDAIIHYTTSIEHSRQTGDNMWLAGALEGYAAAVLLLVKLDEPLGDHLMREMRSISNGLGLPSSSTHTSHLLSNIPTVSSSSTLSFGSNKYTIVVKAMMIAEEKVAEAITLYATNVVFCALEVECALRLAKMHEMRHVDNAQHIWLGRERRAIAYIYHAISVPGLNVQQQIECVIEGALTCKRLGMTRKYAFFLYIAALLSAESDNFNMALSFLRRSCEQYGVQIEVHDDQNAPPPPSTYGDGDGDGDGNLVNTSIASTVPVDFTTLHNERSAAWDSMVTQLLSQGSQAALNNKDHPGAALFLSALSRHVCSQSAKQAVTVSAWTLQALGGAGGSGPEGWSSGMARLLQFRGKARANEAESGLDTLSLAHPTTSNDGTTHPLPPNHPADSAYGSGRSLSADGSNSTAGNHTSQSQSRLLSLDDQSRVDHTNSHDILPSPPDGPMGQRDTRNSSAPTRGTSSYYLNFLSGNRENQGHLSYADAVIALEKEQTKGNHRNNNVTTSTEELEYWKGSDRVFPYSHRMHSFERNAFECDKSDRHIGLSPSELPSLRLHSTSRWSAACGGSGYDDGDGEYGGDGFEDVDIDGNELTVCTLDEPGGTIGGFQGIMGWGEDLSFPIVAPGTATPTLVHLTPEIVHALTILLPRSALTAPLSLSPSAQAKMLSHLAASAQGVETEIKAHLPILLSSLRPCRLPEGTEPRRCKTTSLRHLEAILHQHNSSKDTSTKGEGMVGDGEGADPGKNQLFYDPFSHRKQKQKEKEESSNSSCVWSVGSMCTVAATFYNPLWVPFTYSSIELMVKGGKITSYPTQITVPPRAQHYTAYLQLMPLSACSEMKILGVRSQVGNIHSQIWVEQDGSVGQEVTVRRYRCIGQAEAGCTGGAGVGSGVGVGVKNTRVIVVDAGPCMSIASPSMAASHNTFPFKRTCVGPDIEEEGYYERSMNDSTNTRSAPFSLSGSVCQPLILYRGESRTQWVRLSTNNLTTITRFTHRVACMDMRVIAYQWTAVGTGDKDDIRCKRYILTDFSQLLGVNGGVGEGNSDVGGCCVQLGRCHFSHESKDAESDTDSPTCYASLSAWLCAINGREDSGSDVGEVKLEVLWSGQEGVVAVEVEFEIVGAMEVGERTGRVGPWALLSLYQQNLLNSNHDEVRRHISSVSSGAKRVHRGEKETGLEVYSRKCSLAVPLTIQPCLNVTLRGLHRGHKQGKKGHLLKIHNLTTRAVTTHTDNKMFQHILPPLSARSVLLNEEEYIQVRQRLRWECEGKEGEVSLPSRSIRE